MKNNEQQIRFCTSSDGVSLAYATVGSGPPLVKAANWLNHRKVHAAVGRLRAQQGRSEAARRAFDCASNIIQEIAENVDDEGLRKTFLTSVAVREVLANVSHD